MRKLGKTAAAKAELLALRMRAAFHLSPKPTPPASLTDAPHSLSVGWIVCGSGLNRFVRACVTHKLAGLYSMYDDISDIPKEQERISWSRGKRDLYHTKSEALRAARYETEQDVMHGLVRLDTQIAEQELKEAQND